MLNDYSSRSHCIYEFTLTKKTITEGTSTIEFKSTFQVVDLAGCESLNKTQSNVQMSAEGKDINKSMLVLARIIMDLAKKSNTKSNRHPGVLPWRDSKLTMMLKKCMDGNSYFSFIACLSPLYINQFETVNTLE